MARSAGSVSGLLAFGAVLKPGGPMSMPKRRATRCKRSAMRFLRLKNSTQPKSKQR